MAETALIVGAGTGISASLARLCAREGMQVALAARDIEKLGDLEAETGAKSYACDAVERGDVEALFANVSSDLGEPDLVVYNASGRARGPFAELDPDAVERTLMITCFGGFLVAQAAVKQMEARGEGTILFTGASASVKGYPRSAPFAMGKFGLRGMVQSMARELHPKNIHVAHFVIDGGVYNEARTQMIQDRARDSFLDPDAIAETYLQVYRQPKTTWTWEIELRPWVERF